MKKKEFIFLAVGIVMIVLSIIIRNIIPTKESIKKSMSEITEVTKENVKSYFYPDTILTKIGNNYLVYKDDNRTVIRINEDLVSEMDETPFNGIRYKLVGVSKKLTDEQIDELLKYHNEVYSYSNESQIERDDVEAAYGPYYLEVDSIVDDWTIGNVGKQIANILLEIGIVLSLLGLILSI